jgi:hypothetical protein
VVVADDAEAARGELALGARVVERRDPHAVRQRVGRLPRVRHGDDLRDDARAPPVLDAADEQPAALVRVLARGVPLDGFDVSPCDLDHTV